MRDLFPDIIGRNQYPSNLPSDDQHPLTHFHVYPSHLWLLFVAAFVQYILPFTKGCGKEYQYCTANIDVKRGIYFQLLLTNTPVHFLYLCHFYQATSHLESCTLMDHEVCISSRVKLMKIVNQFTEVQYSTVHISFCIYASDIEIRLGFFLLQCTEP